MSIAWLFDAAERAEILDDARGAPEHGVRREAARDTRADDLSGVVDRDRAGASFRVRAGRIESGVVDDPEATKPRLPTMHAGLRRSDDDAGVVDVVPPHRVAASREDLRAGGGGPAKRLEVVLPQAEATRSR